MKSTSVVWMAGLLAAMASSAVAAPTVADTLAVSISAFTAVDPTTTAGTRMGELCGTVTGSDAVAKGTVHVRVTVDPNSGNPATYVVLPDQNGDFCGLVLTYTGSVSAEAFIAGARGPASSAAFARITPHPIR